MLTPTIYARRIPLLLVAGLSVFTLLSNTMVQANISPETKAADTTPAKAKMVKATDIAARVNGTPIYRSELEPYVDKGVSSYQKFTSREDVGLVKRIRERALEQLISQELIYQASQKLTIPDLNKLVEQKILAMQTKHATPDQLAKNLKKNNQTMDSLKQSVRKQVYVETYLKQKNITTPIISEKELRAFYDKDPSAYYHDENSDVSHILIEVKDDADKKRIAQAKKEALDIRQQILAGKDFAEMAKQHSACGSAAAGGKLGLIKKGYMPKAFEEVAFTQKNDAISKPIFTKFGYHIIKVNKKMLAGNAPFKDVKDFIRTYMENQTSKEKLIEHIAELKNKEKIERFLNE